MIEDSGRNAFEIMKAKDNELITLKNTIDKLGGFNIGVDKIKIIIEHGKKKNDTVVEFDIIDSEKAVGLLYQESLVRFKEINKILKTYYKMLEGDNTPLCVWHNTGNKSGCMLCSKVGLIYCDGRDVNCEEHSPEGRPTVSL